MELVIHFSDIHYSDEISNINNEIELIANSISSFFKDKEIDGMVLAITGDLAKTGNTQEFELCSHFIGKMIFKLNKKLNLDKNRTSVITCPGNHDLNFKSRFSREDYKKMSLDEKVNFYTNSLSNYYSSKLNPMPNINWLTCNKKIKYSDFYINFSCINTTIGSIYEKDETDKGIHSMPLDELDKLITDPKDINFLLMHHSKEWFAYEEWDKLMNLEKCNYNVVLFGHEHKNRDNHIENNGVVVEEICGGALLGQNSIFNLITIEPNKHISFYKSIRKDDFYEILPSGPEYRIIHNNNLKQIYSNDFLEELNEYSLVDDAKLNDIFVFPTMDYTNNNDEDIKIESFDDIEYFLLKEDAKMIIINGDDLSGKSYLSKSLFLGLMDNYHPLLLEPYDFHTGKIDNCFKRLISKEYNSNKVSYSKYFQFEDRKIAIFDDFDLVDIEKSNKIKKFLVDNFDKLIIIKNQNNTNLLKSLLYTCDNYNTISINLSPMLYRKREKLIYNICSYYNKSKNEKENRKMASVINETISKQLKILNLTPQFVVLCVNSMLKNNIQLGSSNGFTSVFHSNIVSQLEKSNLLSKDDIDEYLFLLQNIAYKAHIDGEYPIPLTIFSLVIDNYNKEGQGIRPSVSVSDFINNLEKCKMIQKSRNDVNKFTFISSNYFSFFVAKNIVALISDSKMDYIVVDKLIREMCFGVNGDILLYLSYILQSAKIIDLIYAQSKSFFEQFEHELDLNPNSCNIKYLQLKKSKLMLELPDLKDKENNLRKREKDEEVIVKKKKEIIDYNYSDIDLENSFIKIKQAIKYIEILSRLLPDFMYLNSPACKDIVQGLYSYANKLIFYVLKPYEELFEKDSKLLVELYESGDISNEFEDADKLKYAIQEISNNFILNVYNLIARLSSSKKTIYAYDNLCNNSLATNKILNLMIHENVEELEQFSHLILAIDKKYDDIVIQNFLKRIVRHYCLNNSISYYGQRQMIINKYLISKPNKNKVIQLRRKKVK